MDETGGLEARLWSKVEKAPGPDGCWTWKGTTTHDGYGRIRVGPDGAGSHEYAHVVAYRLQHGRDVPKGHQLGHHCPGGPNRACVRHVKPVTFDENMEERDRRRAKEARMSDAIRAGARRGPR